MEHRKESLANRIARTFKGMEFTLKMAYEKFTKLGYPEEQIRARIYEKLGVQFERIGRGLYISPDDTVALVEGDGRDLSFLADKSIDCIITDHPWLDKKANTGGTRCFANYETVRYTLENYKKKARVLKHGCFLVEMIPAENETNYQYLYQLKKMAEDRLLLFDEELMTFTMGNCITLEDTNGNRKLYKKRYDQKIDAVAALMDAYIAYKNNREAFE